MFMAVLFLCVVVAIMLWLFFGYHLYMIKEGFSTNENSKHSYLSYYIESSVKVFTEWEKIRKEDPEANPPESYVKRFRLDTTMKLDRIQGMLKRLKKDQEIIEAGSPYKPSSLFQGLKEIAFPHYYYG